MHTPRTYMRTSRTYILYSNDMHVKHTRQTERKKNKSKHKTKQSIQTYLAENQFVSAAARQCFSQHHKNNTKHTATSHAHTHTIQMQTKINQTNKYRNHIKKKQTYNPPRGIVLLQKVKKHKLYVNKQTINRKNKKENQVQT